MERLISTRNESLNSISLADILIHELASRGLTISTAEGCSGGAFADALTIPGATRAVRIGGIFYSKESKIYTLGVPEEIIREHGEYSLQTAIAMASAIRKKRDDSFAIATVGDLDPPNSNEPRYVYEGFSMRGRKPWGRLLIFSPKSRIELKEELATNCFIDAILYLQNRPASNFSQFKASDILNPCDQELTVTAEKFVKKTLEKRLRVGTIESCTGGAIANAITNVRGASKIFDMGWLAYDENVKAMLGVPMSVMAFGCVYSERVALAMAEALLAKSDLDIVIATTGLMDTIDTRPFHNDTKPGTIYVAICLRGQKPLVTTLNLSCSLMKDRQDMKTEASKIIFDLALELINSCGKSNNVASQSMLFLNSDQ